MVEVKKLRKGNYILHKDEPYIVKATQTVVTGTHTHTKVKMAIHGVFNKVNENLTLGTHEHLPDVEIIRKEGSVLSKTGSVAQIMDTRSYETFDADIEEELVDDINEGDNVTYIDYKGKTKVVEKR